jgi:hypothetical protein
MARFHDLLATLGVGEDGVSTAYPDTFTDDLSAAYDEDFSVPSAKIQVLETENAELAAQIATLKAHNYDLLMQIPTAATPDQGGEGENDENPDSEDEEPDELDAVFAD